MGAEPGSRDRGPERAGGEHVRPGARAGCEIHETARRIALALKDAYSCDGISTRQHNEPGGNQEVWHYHVHVFPRYAGDGLYGAPWHDTVTAEREPSAAKLRHALNAR